MATEIFAKIGDIKGESLDTKHKDEIEVLSFSWSVANSGPTGGGGAGKAIFQDLAIVHGIDKATPELLKACATGRHIAEATITHRKARTGRQEFLIIRLTDVTITAVNHSGSEDQSYVESVTLRFAKVDFEYKPQRADGSLDPGLHFKFDLKTGQAG